MNNNNNNKNISLKSQPNCVLLLGRDYGQACLEPETSTDVINLECHFK